MRDALFAVGLAALASVAHAQDGDAVRGRDYALSVCSECHAVEKGQVSPNPLSPTFAEIAAVPGMTRTALIVALRTPHRDMPDIVLDRDELSNVVAYILTLQPSP